MKYVICVLFSLRSECTFTWYQNMIPEFSGNESTDDPLATLFLHVVGCCMLVALMLLLFWTMLWPEWLADVESITVLKSSSMILVPPPIHVLALTSVVWCLRMS